MRSAAWPFSSERTILHLGRRGRVISAPLERHIRFANPVADRRTYSRSWLVQIEMSPSSGVSTESLRRCRRECEHSRANLTVPSNQSNRNTPKIIHKISASTKRHVWVEGRVLIASFPQSLLRA